MYLKGRLEHKFTQEWDGDYNPALGRFLTEDPIGFSGGDTNLYRYVGNSPLIYIDPMGNRRVGEIVSLPFAGRFGGGGFLLPGLPILVTDQNILSKKGDDPDFEKISQEMDRERIRQGDLFYPPNGTRPPNDPDDLLEKIIKTGVGIGIGGAVNKCTDDL